MIYAWGFDPIIVVSIRSFRKKNPNCGLERERERERFGFLYWAV